MKLVLDIPQASPSSNAFVNKRGRFAYSDLRKKWERLVNEAYLEVRRDAGRRTIWVKPPQQRVRVHIERFSPGGNSLDPDGFVGGLKPVIDALRRLELIDDDNAKAIDLVTAQPMNPHRTPRYWTRITLELIEVTVGKEQ